MDDLLRDVLDRVRPTPEQEKQVEGAARRLLSAVRGACRDLGVDADPLIVGSLAKGTWLVTSLDIDCFLAFPPDTPRRDLESDGLRVGRAVLDGEARYAEHPYIQGTWEGFEADVVPCFRVESPDEPMTAVDRTPYHNEFVIDHLDADRRDEVRLFKQFLHGIGAYGAETRTQGVSGYLAELLVIHLGSFPDVLSAVRDWDLPVEIDIAGHAGRAFEEPLVVVDPVDGSRNAAAAVSRDKLDLLIEAAGAFLADPTEAFFFPADLEPLDAEALSDLVEGDDHVALGVAFARPDAVDDTLYPQLRKSGRGIRELLQREGFTVRRSGVYAGPDRCLLVWVVSPRRLPETYVHRGPPVDVADHGERFRAKWEDHPDAAGPVMERDGRLFVEVSRDHRGPGEVVLAHLDEVGLGTQVEAQLADGWDPLVGGQLVEAVDPLWLTDLFDDRRPWER